MTHDLFIGDRMFSSWSLRGWLMFAAFDLPVRVHMAGLYSGTLLDDLQPVAPARLVPAMRLSDGTVVGESLAMAETLAERHAEAGLWPADPRQRATARWFCAEMVSGFQDLRADCPMQLRTCWRGFRPSPAVLADLDRLAVIWAHARAVSGADTGWLFGQYSLADVFFTPVAARVGGDGLPLSLIHI